MNLQLTITHVAPDELPDVIDAFADVHVTWRGTPQGTYKVTTPWTDDLRFFGQNVDALHRFAERGKDRALAAATP